MHPAPTQHAVSVVISAYTERRWDDLVAAVRSVERQTVPVEIVVAVDRNPDLLARVRRELPVVLAAENVQHAGAGGARNSGVAMAGGNLIAFLDDDAVADERWIEELLAGFADDTALGVGGRIRPHWLAGRPSWFPEEFDWVVGCTYRGLPTTTTPVRNLIAANMAVRRDVFEELGGFRTDFGKVGVRSSPEETDFCIRALQRFPHRAWVYHPPAEVRHTVPAERGRVRYFVERCWYEGLGKGDLAGLVGDRSGLSSEWRYTLEVLPRGVVRGLLAGVRGQVAGFERAAAITVGLVVVVAGFLYARLAAR